MKLLYITLLSLSTTASAAFAQDLNKEITIDRTISPELRAISRPAVNPELLQPKLNPTSLSFSESASTAEVPPYMTTLEAASPGVRVPVSPYRGYAALGYFPTFNLGASAGYRFLQSPRTALGAWMQYDGHSYRSDGMLLRRNTATAGADFSHIFSGAGRLDLRAGYTYDNLNSPLLEENAKMHTNAADVDAVWSARNQISAYFIQGKWSLFRISGSDSDIIGCEALPHSLGQNIFTARAGGSYFLSNSSSVAALVSYEGVRYGHFDGLLPEAVPTYYTSEAKTLGLITLAPSYRANTSFITARVGLKAQLTLNSGKTFHVAPDVDICLRPADVLSINLSAGGGEHINKLRDLYYINPYMSRSSAYYFSHIPLTFGGSIKAGPWKGASLTLGASYAAANEWLMPQLWTAAIAGFEPEKMRCWQFTAKADWTYSSLLKLGADYAASPGTRSHAWYLNPDRARHILSVRAASEPVAGLDIEASWEMRLKRSLMLRDGSAMALDHAASLNIGARYALTDQWSVYARGENILGRRSRLVSLYECQGIHGLVGATYKF